MLDSFAFHAGQMVVALLLDALLGWPALVFARIGHPVSWIGHVVSGLDRNWNRDALSPVLRRLAGVGVVLVVTGLAGGVGLGLCFLLPHNGLGVLIGGGLAWPLLAVRSLYAHVLAVVQPLSAGDMPGARKAVSMIVGRDPNVLDSAGIARAAAESLAENTSDGVVAPLFWGVLLGLPGLYAYKAINTMDSMIANRTPRYRLFGWAAARVDDVVNIVPARLSGVLYALASAAPLRAFRVMLRDARRHRSPNAGWPEAAMAGGLGIRLSGPRLYAEGPSRDPWLNDGAPDPTPTDLAAGLVIYRRVVLLATLFLLILFFTGSPLYGAGR
ncbi:MAG: adenosylcobinamide-phosphate synthase CbiB [Acetobacter papayae]